MLRRGTVTIGLGQAVDRGFPWQWGYWLTPLLRGNFCAFKKGTNMKNLFKGVALGLLLLAFNTTTFAGDKGTKEEAVALVKKAVAYLNAHGKEQAAAAFNDPKGEFVDRDLYVYAADVGTGIAWAHGANAKIVGKSVRELKDADGKYFVKELLEVAQAKNHGWVDYKWPNPVTKAIDAKTTYVEKVGNNVIACGVYK